MKFRFFALQLACAQALWFATPSMAADFQKGLRLKAANQLEAAANEFAAVVKESPNNTQAIEQLATVSGWLARYDVAITQWQRLLVLQPQRDDARISMARVRYWKGENQEALKILNDVLTRLPTNADALSLRGDVLLANGDSDAAKESYLTAELSGADKAEIARKLAKIVPQKRWRVDVGATQDKYSNERGVEGGSFIQLGYQFSRGLNVYGRYENARQFGAVDNTVFVGGYWRIVPDVLLHVEAGSTQNAAFRPSSQFLVEGDLLTFKTVQPLLGFRQSTYDGSPVLAGTLASGKGSVGTVIPGVRIVIPRIGDVEFRYAISENIDKSITQVSQLRINVDAGEKWAPYIAFYSGEEALPPQPSASFKSYALGTVYKVSPQWSVRADLSHEDRQNFYIRNSAGLGLSYLF